MKQLTAKIQKDIKEFIYILEDVHEKSRTTRRIGVGIAVAGLGKSYWLLLTMSDDQYFVYHCI